MQHCRLTAIRSWEVEDRWMDDAVILCQKCKLTYHATPWHWNATKHKIKYSWEIEINEDLSLTQLSFLSYLSFLWQTEYASFCADVNKKLEVAILFITSTNCCHHFTLRKDWNVNGSLSLTECKGSEDFKMKTSQQRRKTWTVKLSVMFLYRYLHAQHTVKLLRFQVLQWKLLPVSHSLSSVCVVCHENTQTNPVKSEALQGKFYKRLLSAHPVPHIEFQTFSIAFYSPIQP